MSKSVLRVHKTDDPPSYNEYIPARNARGTNPSVLSTVGITFLPIRHLDQLPLMYSDQIPQQIQPGHPLPGNEQGFQTEFQTSQKNDTSQLPYPHRIGRAQENISLGIPPYANESAFRNTPSDMNPLTYPACNENGDNEVPEHFNFYNASVTRTFIKMVYIDMMLHHLIMMGLIALLLFNTGINEFLAMHDEIRAYLMGVYFVTGFSIACFEAPRRTFPYNAIFLGTFAMCLKLYMAVMASSYVLAEVLMAAGMTTAVCLALTLLTFQSKYSLTGPAAYTICFTVPLIAFGMLAVIARPPVARSFYTVLSTALLNCCLVYDTQLFVKRKHRYKITSKDHVFAALSVYLHPIVIILKLFEVMKE